MLNHEGGSAGSPPLPSHGPDQVAHFGRPGEEMRLPQPREAPESQPEPAATACPDCDTPLQEEGNRATCPRCGYWEPLPRDLD